MKKLLFFLLISVAAFGQGKVPYGTASDITPESDLWLRYNFASRAYDIYFKDASDVTSPASDSVIVAGTVRFKKLFPSGSLLTAIQASAPITYNATTGTIGLNYDSLYSTADDRYFRLQTDLTAGDANIPSGGRYMINDNPVIDASAGAVRLISPLGQYAIVSTDATATNSYRNFTHAFADPTGADEYARFTSSGLSVNGGNATIGNDGRAYFGWRTSIGKAPTSNMLEVGGSVNFDGELQLNRRIDIDGGFISGIAGNESLINFKNHNGSNMGRVGDFNMSDLYVDLMGIKGTGLSVGAYGSEERVLAIDTLQQVKIISGKTGIAQALTINNDSTLATAGRGSELKFTATGDTTLASIQVVTQTTNNKVGLMKFLTSNGTTNAVRLTIDQNGNVGIGDETPSYTLDISGSLRTTASAYFATSSGNVVIGGTTAIEKLTVDGSIRSSNGAILSYKDGSNSLSNQLYLANAANSRAYNWQLNADGSAADFWGFLDGVGWGRLMTITANGRVGIGTATPAAGALLDLSSTSLLLLPPKMTTTQAGAISTKPTGGMYYDTTLNKMRFWNGSAYETITSAP